MKHIYSVIGVCLCAVLLAACGANKAVYPAVTTSHAAPESQAQHHANPFIRNEFVYVANGGSSNISAFKVGGGGALTPVAGSPFAVGIPPINVAVDESGKFAYVSSSNYPNPTGTVSAYRISPFSGVLTPISGSPYTEGNGPYALAVDPRGGTFAYVVNVFSNDVSAYKINQHSGALNAIGGSPFGAGGQPEALAEDPLGRFLFVPNTETNNVSAYTVDSSTGKLTQVAGSPFGAGTTPNSAAVDPTGAFLYLTNPNSDNISGYAVNQSSGVLTQVAGSPFGVTGNPIAVAIDPMGRFAYVVINTVGIDAFTINPNSGALTLVAGSPFGGGAPNRLTVDLKGRYLYDSDGNDIRAFAMNQSSGALTEVAGSPFAAGTGPSGLAVWGSQ